MNTLIKIEIYKTFRRFMFILYLLFPILFVGFIYLISYKTMDSTLKIQVDYGVGDYSTQFTGYFCTIIQFIYIFVNGVMCYYYFRLERKNKCLNLLFTLPVKRADIYNAKLITMIVYNTINVVLMYVAIFAVSLNFKDVDYIDLKLILQIWIALNLTTFLCFFIANVLKNMVLYFSVITILFATIFVINHNYLFIHPLFSSYYITTGLMQIAINVFYFAVFYYLGFKVFKNNY